MTNVELGVMNRELGMMNWEFGMMNWELGIGGRRIREIRLYPWLGIGFPPFAGCRLRLQLGIGYWGRRIRVSRAIRLYPWLGMGN